MNTKIKILGGVLKRIAEFKMHRFEDRLMLQKRVYLLQAFGLYLGYRFSWYLHGPYSPDLTQDAYDLLKHWNVVELMNFPTAELESKFSNYLKFLDNRKNDPKWLELTASIHFLKKIYPEYTDEELFQKIRLKDPHFTIPELENSLKELKKIGLV